MSTSTALNIFPNASLSKAARLFQLPSKFNHQSRECIIYKVGNFNKGDISRMAQNGPNVCSASKLVFLVVREMKITHEENDTNYQTTQSLLLSHFSHNFTRAL